MEGQRHIGLIERYYVLGRGGRVGNGRVNAYRLENTTVDKYMMEKGWVGGLGMVGQRYIDFIERYGCCWERLEGWEWEGGQIYDGEGMGGRVGNGRAWFGLLEFNVSLSH